MIPISQTSRGILNAVAKALTIILGILIVGLMVAAPIVFLHNFRLYDDAKEGFHLHYPSDWEVQHPLVDDTVVIFMSPRGDEKEFVANVSITYTDFSQQPMTIEEYAQLSVRQMTGVFQDVVAETPRPVNLSGHPGYRMVFSSKTDPKLTFDCYAFLFDNKGYNITYVGKTDRYQRIDKYIVEVMIRSLKLDF